MASERIRQWTAGSVLALLVGTTWWVSPGLHVLDHAARHPQAYADSAGPDAAALVVVCVLAWLVLGWLAVGLLFSAAAALPGAVGSGCESVADRLLPGAVRRAAALSLGLSVAAGGVSGAAALTHRSTAPAARPPATVLRLDWPGGRTPGPADGGVDWPTGPAPRPTPRPAPRSAPVARSVVVAPGDCLWSIAARELDPGASDSEIATAWQRWYAANRTVIGPDPDLIRPGQRLTAPEDRSTP